jgi:hypothetical protein
MGMTRSILLAGNGAQSAAPDDLVRASLPAEGSEAALTPEYQAIIEANFKVQAEGGQGTTPTYNASHPACRG